MILTQRAIRAIKHKERRIRVALGLGVTEQWIIKILSTNKPDNLLTTARALSVIEKETGLSGTEVLKAD